MGPSARRFFAVFVHFCPFVAPRATLFHDRAAVALPRGDDAAHHIDRAPGGAQPPRPLPPLFRGQRARRIKHGCDLRRGARTASRPCPVPLGALLGEVALVQGLVRGVLAPGGARPAPPGCGCVSAHRAGGDTRGPQHPWHQSGSAPSSVARLRWWCGPILTSAPVPEERRMECVRQRRVVGATALETVPPRWSGVRLLDVTRLSMWRRALSTGKRPREPGIERLKRRVLGPCARRKMSCSGGA